MEQLKKDIDKYIGILTEINEEIQLLENEKDILAFLEFVEIASEKIRITIENFKEKKI